jgi:hypothetical protein
MLERVPTHRRQAMTLSQSGWRLLGHWLMGALLAAVLCGCASVKVTTDYDPSASFSAYKSYAWLPEPTEKTGDIRVDNPLLHTRVRDAVEAELALKGYEKLAGGKPDFFIGYHLSLTTKLDVTRMNNYYGYGVGRRWGAAGVPETVVTEYEVGALVLDVVDAKREKLVWRGSGQRRVQESPTPEETTRRVREAVAEILKRFPPE